MIRPDIPMNEEQRLLALAQVAAVDPVLKGTIDRVTRRLASVCETPICAVTFVGADRTWAVSSFGLAICDVDRDRSFCSHAINEPDGIFLVTDARIDLRFWDNPFVVEDPFVRFYAGTAIVTHDGFALGMLCVIDKVPRSLSSHQSAAIRAEALVIASALKRHDAAATLASAAESPARSDARRPLSAAPTQMTDFSAAVIDSIPGVFYVVRAKGKFLRWNKQLEVVTGYAAGEIAAVNPLDLLVERDRASAARSIEHCLATGTTSSEASFLTKDGRSLPYSFNSKLIEYEGQACLIGVGLDASEQRRAQEKLEFAALHDPLTGLGNRTMLSDRLRHSVQAASRKSNAVVAVLYFDLDRFKRVNDTLGHIAGDALLVAVGKRIAGRLRAEDTIVRLGGDEFVVVADLARNDDVISLASTVMASFAEPYSVAGALLEVSVSLGISVYPFDSREPDDLLRNADTAMYRAKAEGGNVIQVYAPAMHEAAMNRFTVENEIREGIRRGEFELYYQPVVNLHTGSFVSAEALIRWNHPKRGLVMPKDFIDIAEETGLIEPLGAWVLREGAKQAQRLDEMGFDRAHIAVNVSARQLRGADFLDQVRAIGSDPGFCPGSFGIELTESVALREPERALNILDECKRLGLVILLDDFGTHYSSLTYLKKFPIDVIKIDKTFIDGLPGEANDRGIVSAIIGLGKSLQCDVLAEGIESESQGTWLAQHGCLYGTGFLFARPMPAPLFRKWLLESRAGIRQRFGTS
ncbi:MAG: hypothetical protein NVSMB64_26810 [Candidatus Velthaea sp.]